MPQLCKACSRVNPPEASYCHYDGAALDSPSAEIPADGSAMNIGAKPFAVPFVFPTGEACHNFNQLALACCEDVPLARELLEKGYLESFLGGQGRTDLARAARQARKVADHDRGLDGFLAQLPAAVVAQPRLRVEPAEVDLGVASIGEDRTFSLTLHNDGLRLLTGAASVEDCAWLSLGGATGVSRKMLQFFDRTVLPVRVRGAALRAYHKPQTGRISLDTNGGSITVEVGVRVAVRPFPEGVLAGALSPRQLAEKAKASPKEAIVLVESGAVARWYRSNGWTYPVQGAPASGAAALQQLFEALGLVRTPTASLSETAVSLRGNPGQRLEYALNVTVQENRAAVAHGVSDKEWLEVGRTQFKGRIAVIPLVVRAVPLTPGVTLGAKVAVVANGNQRFVVSVTLTVLGKTTAAPAPVAAAPASPAPDLWRSVVSTPLPPVATVPVTPVRPRIWPHLVLPGLVALILLGALTRDLLFGGADDAVADDDRLLDAEPRLAVQFHDKPDDIVPPVTMTFGLVMTRESDPANPKKKKRLTFDVQGRSNNTCCRLDGKDYLLGYEGAWLTLREPLPADAAWERQGCRSTWTDENKRVVVTQHVEIVPGGQSRLLDTCLVRYTLENRDASAHAVGLRLLLDTFIGARDGVPFAVPGDRALCDTKREFKDAASVPDFLEALETDDLRNPGTVAHLSLKLDKHIELPTRVTLGAWPDVKLRTTANEPLAQGQATRWNVPVASMKALDPPDSAVALYWDEKPLDAHAKREIGFAYGLGSLAGAEGQGRLALTLGGEFAPGGEFSVTAYVKEPAPGETLTLVLPAGLTSAAGDGLTQPAPIFPGAGGIGAAVTWKVRAAPRDKKVYRLRVVSSAGASQAAKVTIKSRRLFD